MLLEYVSENGKHFVLDRSLPASKPGICMPVLLHGHLFCKAQAKDSFLQLFFLLPGGFMTGGIVELLRVPERCFTAGASSIPNQKEPSLGVQHIANKLRLPHKRVTQFGWLADGFRNDTDCIVAYTLF